MTTVVKKYLEWEPLDSPPKLFEWDTTYQIMDKVIFEGNIWMYIGHIVATHPPINIIESTQVPPSGQFGWVEIKER